MRLPCFVKMQGVDFAIEHAFDRVRVVHDAVIGTLRKRENLWLAGFVLNQRMRVDFALNGFHQKFGLRNRPDDTVVVARRREKYRNCTGHDDGVQIRFVAVAIHHHDITRRHAGVPDDFIRGGRAVGHEKAMIGLENTRGVLLRIKQRARVRERLAKLLHRVTDIRAQHIFTVKLMKQLPHGAFQIRHAARMAGRVPRIRGVLRVIDQGLEKRGKQPIDIQLRLAQHAPRHEFVRVLKHIHETVHLTQHVGRQIARSMRASIQENRDVEVARTNRMHHRTQILDGLRFRLIQLDFAVLRLIH